VNIHKPQHHFEVRDAGSPLILETERGTFKVNWSSVRFDWAPDSQKFFMTLEILKGTWRTLFVDLDKGSHLDVTADLESGLNDKADFHDWGCEPPRFEVVTWTKPTLAFLKLTSLCGKNKDKENNKQFFLADSVLFDTLKAKVVTQCMDCKDEKSLKVFEKYYQKSIPTPTPTPEETPTTP